MILEPKLELLAKQALAFKLLTASGAWQLRKGSATIHFDKDGTPASVEVRAFTVIPNSPNSGGGQDFMVVV